MKAPQTIQGMTLVEFEVMVAQKYTNKVDSRKKRGMNLAIKAKSEREAFSDALEYYQHRLKEVESAHKCLSSRVDAFVSQFTDDDE